ncbi:hypothetical protein HOLleu_42041 [Holothuria leucospilota]|uniref:Uncharacterized protein n=1 Tax=Holothuria leucospilota TaxID=206669 RepID=A0A9Q1BAC5_HOLLE|nr:hypothetical protein HOLleu_42041 [Holothuria leucospilota]
MGDKKVSKEAPRKSPQVSKVKATSAYTPPTLRHRSNTDSLSSSDSALQDLRSSIELAFQRLHDKVDSMLLNQEQMLGRIATLEATQKDLEKSAGFLSTAVEDLKAEHCKFAEETQRLDIKFQELDKLHGHLKKYCHEKFRSVSEAQLKAERYSRSYNLRFRGIAEKQDENPIAEVQNILRNHLKLDNTIIENAHRVGQRRPNKPRHIIAKLLYRPQRQEVLTSARRSLANTAFFITEDLTQEDFKTKARLRPLMDKAFKEGKRPRFRNGQLFVNGEPYIEQTSSK